MFAEAEEYRKHIADMRSARKGGISRSEIAEIASDMPPIDETIDMMETANQAIGRAAETEVRSVRDHLSYMVARGVSFDDRRFEHLFSDRNVSANGLAQESSSTYKGAKGKLDYSYRERMAGFAMKSGGLEWEDGRIDDFVDAIRKNNTVCTGL